MIARKSLLIAISQFITRLLGWIGLVILAKLWGGFAPEALGVIGFAMAFIGVFSVIADLGFGQAHIKRISEGKDLGACIGTFAAIKISLIAVMVLTIFLALYVLEHVFHQGITDATTFSVVMVFLLYYVLLNIQYIPTYTFNGRGEIAKMQLTTMCENFIKVPTTILVAVAGVSMAGLAAAVTWPGFLQPLQQYLATHPLGSLAMTYTLGIFSTVVVGMWLLRKYPIKKPDRVLAKSYFRFAVPILLISIISTLSINIDKLMIGFFWTSVEVGYYFSLQQILQIILILSFSFNIVLFPAYSEFHAQKNFGKINTTTHLAERYISMVIIPPIIFIILFVQPVISIMLNSAFLPAASTLSVLTIYALLTSFMAPYSSLMSGLDKPSITAKIGLAMCSANIVLNYAFIPKDGVLSILGINGPTGAAVATTLSALVGYVSMKIMAKKMTGIAIFQTHTPRHILAGLIMGGALYYIGSLFLTIRWYHLVLFSAIGLLLYCTLLFVLKEFTKKDLLFFLDLVHPKQMVNYIKKEFLNINDNN